jgi:hypothetical protein
MAGMADEDFTAGAATTAGVSALRVAAEWEVLPVRPMPVATAAARLVGLRQRPGAGADLAAVVELAAAASMAAAVAAMAVVVDTGKALRLSQQARLLRQAGLFVGLRKETMSLANALSVRGNCHWSFLRSLVGCLRLR